MNKQFFKISVIDTEFFTNLEKNTVTCKIYYKIKASDSKMDYIVNAANMFVDGGMFADTVYTAIATSKLYPGDVFDQHKGEQISRAKAESMAYKRVGQFFERLSDWYMHNVSTPMANFVEKSKGVIEHNYKYIGSF